MRKPSKNLLHVIELYKKPNKPSHVPKKYPTEYQELLELTVFLPEAATTRQRFWHIENNQYTIPLCKHCNEKYVKWHGHYEYVDTCSMQCQANLTSTREKIKQTNLDRYGAICTLQHIDVNEKRKQTMIDRYGAEFTMQSDILIEQVKQTNLERYGTENAAQSDRVRKKIKQTTFDKYGFENSMHSPEIQEKSRQTNLKNRGTEYPMQSPEVREKAKQTSLDRYGVEHAPASKEAREKAKRTMNERYGVNYPLQNDDIFNNMIITNLERHGVENVFQSEVIKERIKETNLERYGDSIYKRSHIPDDIWEKLENREYLLMLHIDKKMSQTDIGIFLGVPNGLVCNYFEIHTIECHRYYNKSSQESLILEYIRSLYDGDISCGSRSIVYPYEIDIYIPELHIAIEFDGIYWHSDGNGKSNNYHLNKTKMCNDNGVRLIHIFENEWKYKQNIVKSRIANILNKSIKIGARNTKVVEISRSQTNEFLNETHIQGTCLSSINLGLEFNNELVACMTFGKSRFDKTIEWELLRYSNKLNTSVVGGASKLFKYFIKNYNPQSVISYSDKRWNTGRLYENLGFTYSHTSTPNYFYFHKNSVLTLESRQKFQKHKLKDLPNFNFDSQLTEWQNMINNGYDRIWDCGNDVFIYRSNIIE